MDRYNEVKVLLKNWEQEFVKEHRKKPTKEDIDQAPEETKGLYKEYRRLKQAKENSCKDTVGRDQSGDAPEATAALKEPESWGAHLNRSAQPTPPPRLTSQERDSLKASAQYFGLKLKSNLALLTKDRPLSHKKSFHPGRVPLNSLKVEHGQASQGTAATTIDPLSPQNAAASLAPGTDQPLASGDQYKPFDPVSDSFDDSFHTNCDNSKSSFKKTVGTDNVNVSGLNPSPAGASVPSSSLASPANVGIAKRDSAFKEDQQVFRGVRGIAARPSPVGRLSLIDTKWLERCQVFGEMETEVKPGAGNQEKPPGMREEEVDRIAGNKEKDGLRDAGHSEGGEALKGHAPDEDVHKRRPKQSQQLMQENATDGQQESPETSLIPLANTEDKNKLKKNGDYTKKKGKKRQREGETMGGEVSEEGGVKKRRRNAKKESSDGNPSPDQAGGKKRRVKKKDGETEEEKDTKLPKEDPKENLLGELEEEYKTRRTRLSLPVRARNPNGPEGNFVKINLKKKSHVKGYALRGVGLRKQLYMQKFQLKGERFGGGAGYFGRGRRGGFRGGFSRQGDTCYKCGETGHWAIDCKGRAPPPSAPEDPPAVEEPFELPTLEEVARATGTLRSGPLASPGIAEEHEKNSGLNPADEVLLNVMRPDYERPAPPPPVEPLYDLDDAGNVRGTPADVHAALRELGYQSFRPGQEEAIMRILSGLSTLVVLSTGMGKSLCYQLPAYLYAKRSNSITLVISPLVSLMDDQLSGLPANLKAACIHSNMTMKQREAAVEKVKSGQVCVLLLSPEALVGGGGSGSGCLPSAQELPPVAFACIDEAHCVSEWSHNFRPCYLRLCKVLRERLGVQCFLGLTATATLSTALDIARHLDIRNQDGIAVRSAAVPPNLHLSVSMDREKDQALVSLLKGERFDCLDSVIVYCTRREETVRVAALLRTCLQGVLVKENKQIKGGQDQNNPVGRKKKELARKKIRKPLKWQAESYHAGLSAAERRRVQNNFMCGELRIVVATVAFGMGLDKSDVRGIIHYNMPKSFESYVQEIGRAGRDGEPAHCHLFLDPEGGDLHELRRHIYADTVDYYTVKKLVQKVFPPCKCEQIQQKHQELAQEIEDSEMLKLLDVCDQGRSTTPRTQEHVSPAPSRSQQTPASPAAGDQEEDHRSGAWEDEGGHWPSRRACHTHERAINIQETVEALDMTEEGVETLLCYLELHPQRFVELLHPTLSVCKISCYDGPRQLQKVTKICPPVAVVLARRRLAGERVETCDQLEFDVVEVADTMGWQLPLVKRGLRQLQWSTGKGGGRSGVLVEFSSLSFYFRSYGDLSDEELDRVCQFLHNRVQKQEKTRLYQLTACFEAFKSVAFRTVSSCKDELDDGRSLRLKSLLSEYFDKRCERSGVPAPEDCEGFDKYKVKPGKRIPNPPPPSGVGTNALSSVPAGFQILDWEDQIRADIRGFLASRSDEKFSGRAVARILHGIGSPCYPAQIYAKDRRYWRKYIQFDFNQLIRLATREIVGFK
ncbi:ATP-dependent DNA helicase Q4 isoform X2 [Takifugu flavidus]|uniref:ATP-dependent DNA helicase Q4 isoform X2 n=1 Tax=Takifugu flavidus TaxID=433684 RepID=UPI0025446EBE|nr:ATP-dependent DNA helicase Q4 isoform X2 [Takifugu flavidus]